MKKIILFSAVAVLALTEAYAQKAVTLTYKYPSDRAVDYLNISKIHEDMDIQGQTMTVDVVSVLGCSIRSAGNQGKNLKLEVKIDTLSQVIDSPQGRMGGNASDAAGKTFSLVIRPDGKVADRSEAEKIIYKIEGTGTTDMSASFIDFFPVLPGDKMTQGHTWTSTDTVSYGTGPNSQFTIVKAENKFEGFEKVLGMDCAKITSLTEGTSIMNNQTQGMDLKTSGTFTGTVVTYFAPSAGYFVKSTSETRMTGQMEMTSPESFTFPVVMTITRTNELRK